MLSFKVQISGSLFQKLELKTLTFYKKDEAIQTLESALNEKEIKFSKEQNGDQVVYLNSSNGELAKIVNSKNA